MKGNLNRLMTDLDKCKDVSSCLATLVNKGYGDDVIVFVYDEIDFICWLV